jgi:type II secretory ATPase GspE/PulE/Tfp pilus assembly ATPase PilB-like protein
MSSATSEPTETGTVANLVADLLQQAHDRGASDLHLVPTEHGLEVSLRCNGILTVVCVLEAAVTSRVVGRFKALADLLAYRTDIPQEGRIGGGRGPNGTEARVSVYPTVSGEKIAVRLDALRQSEFDLTRLNLSTTALRALDEVLDQPDGVVLVTGPSGSGKTTTLYACVERIRRQTQRRQIMTVEDPVERLLAGVAQTELDPAAGLTYSVALQSILRQDPDVILVGEIRDQRTAATVLEAGLTGHLVASTIHAGSCAQTFVRLVEMGIEPFAITSVIRGVLSQRLLRRRCPGLPGTGAARSEHADCTQCRGTGFVGRILIDEWAPMTDALRRAIVARGDTRALEAAVRSSGNMSLRERAEQLVAAATTTRGEVDRVLGSNSCGDAADRRGNIRSELVPSDAGPDVPGQRAVARSPSPARA